MVVHLELRIMAGFKAFTKVGKAGGSALLVVAASMFSVYAMRHFPGWAIVLALLLLVLAAVPLALVFRFVSWPSKRSRPSSNPADVDEDMGMFNDRQHLLYDFHHDDDSNSDKL